MVFSTGMILLISGIFGIAAVVLLTAVVNGWLNRKERKLREQIWREYR